MRLARLGWLEPAREFSLNVSRPWASSSYRRRTCRLRPDSSYPSSFLSSPMGPALELGSTNPVRVRQCDGGRITRHARIGRLSRLRAPCYDARTAVEEITMKKLCLLVGLFTAFAGFAWAGEEYPLGPDSQRQPGVPQGTVTQYTWTSKIFPARCATTGFMCLPNTHRKNLPA